MSGFGFIARWRRRGRSLSFNIVALGILAACSAPGDSATTQKDVAPAKRSDPRLSPAARAAVAAYEPKVSHSDESLGVPTFVWMKKPAGATFAAAGASAEEIAWATVERAQRTLRLGRQALDAASTKELDQAGTGVRIARISQKVGGHEVFRASLNVAMTAGLEPVAITGFLAPSVEPRTGHAGFAMDAASAASAALRAMTGRAAPASAFERTAEGEGGYVRYRFDTVSHARVKKVWLPERDGLDAAYYVELDIAAPGQPDTEAKSFVIDANDGRVLFEKSLTAHAEFSYRVAADPTPPYVPWDGPHGNITSPHPTGNDDRFVAPFVAPALVTLQSAPYSRNDPWLPDGATVTTGNNVDAYADLIAPDGYNAGDLRPTVTAPGVFDRTHLLDIQPNANAEQIAASATQLFYELNWLHDWFYDSGFDEAAGNHQTNNFGRGGLGGDAIRAQTQDYAGMNGSSATTPADGAPARIQMQLFETVTGVRATVNTPAPIAGDYRVRPAAFGPQTFDVTSDVVLVEDGAGKHDGCEPIVNGVAGKIALIAAGACTPESKVRMAQNAGAVGALVAYDAPRGIPRMVDDPNTEGVEIPSFGIALADAALLQAQPAGTVSIRMSAPLRLRRDGALDNLLVAHEWGHTLTNRLVGNASGLSNAQGRALDEGWADFIAMLQQVRAEDINVPSNANWSGVYAVPTFAGHPDAGTSSYFGARRFPYSVDDTKNALRFRHIADGTPLPTTTPINDNGAAMSEPHNAGEVWASMLWECYVALLRAHPFQESQDRMKRYAIVAMKLTPVAPTFLEARDALLAAALANDPADFMRFGAAFARRGAGLNAVAPDRNSQTNEGLVESYDAIDTSVWWHDFEFVSASLTDAPHSCDDDGVLDDRETGRLTVTIRNSGTNQVSGANATVTTTTPGVTFANGGGRITFPSASASETTTGSVELLLDDQTPMMPLDITIELTSLRLRNFQKITVTHQDLVNYDVLPASSKRDDVDTKINVWSMGGNGALPVTSGWEQVTAGRNGHWHIRDHAGASDQWLVSPALEVSADEPFTLDFQTRWSFEGGSAPASFDDGGVIEISTDDGVTWTDAGSYLSAPYGGSVSASGGSALAGRSAFVGISPGYPSWTTVSANFGSSFAGNTVKLRFRAVSHGAVPSLGWDIDALAFSGITNTPFASRVPHDPTCGNTAPVVTGSNVTVREGAPVTLSAMASDLDGDALTFAWTQSAGPAVTLEGASTLTPSFTAPFVIADTVLTFSLVANDGWAMSQPLSVDVTVKNNLAPTVSAGANIEAREETLVTLSGTASDAEGDALTYAWTQTAGPAVTLQGADTLSPSFTAPAVNEDTVLTFSLVAQDALDTSAASTVDVTVKNNRAPTVSAGTNITAKEGTLVTLAGTTTDADGDALTYTWTQKAGPAVQLQDASTLSPKFTAPDVTADTVLTFELVANDGRESSQASSVDVTVTNHVEPADAGTDASTGRADGGTDGGGGVDAAVNEPIAPSEDDGGCSVAAPGRSGSLSGGLSAGVTSALALLIGRRRRRR